MATNAVSTLHSLCQRLVWNATYMSHPPQGPPHCPIIQVTAQLNGTGLGDDVVVTGAGSNTKLAKQEAAKLLLEHPAVIAAVAAATGAPDLNSNHLLLPSSLGVLEAASGKILPKPNHKGALQEALSKAVVGVSRLPGFEPGMLSPAYSSIQVGPSHNPTYDCTVSVRLPGNITACGHGSAPNKKEAEQAAAGDLLGSNSLRQFLGMPPPLVPSISMPQPTVLAANLQLPQAANLQLPQAAN